jgi:NADH-quinone oxidoreductase subunit I
MNGLGIVKGLFVAFRHLAESYIADIKAGPKRYHTPEGIESRRNSETSGIFTVQYPEEKIPVPEEFRFIPMLVYEEGPNGQKNYRCTACGICAKVCPPQCIWIVRSTDPVTGKPMTTPAEFSIDTDICMNCGFCAEYCPFDAIKMDHEYELATYDRRRNHIYNLEKLGRPLSYYAGIRPVNNRREEAERAAKEAAKAARKSEAGA